MEPLVNEGQRSRRWKNESGGGGRNERELVCCWYARDEEEEQDACAAGGVCPRPAGLARAANYLARLVSKRVCNLASCD